MVDAFSIDCLLVLGIDNKSIIFYIDYIFLLLKPVLVFGFLLLIGHIWSKIRDSQTNIHDRKKRRRQIMIIVCFFFQPQIVKESLQMFYCVNLGPTSLEEKFLNISPSIQCWTSSHNAWAFGVALPAFLIWGLLMPLGLFYQVRKKRRKGNIYATLARYAFVVGAYKDDKFFWEFVVTLRKLLLIVILVFFNNINRIGQILLTFIILIVSLMYHNFNHAFKEKRLNFLENLSLLSSSIMAASGIYFAGEDLNYSFGILLSWMAIVSSSIFVLLGLSIYLNFAKKKV